MFLKQVESSSSLPACIFCNTSMTYLIHWLALQRPLFQQTATDALTRLAKRIFPKLFTIQFLEYSFNEFEITGKDYDKLHFIALQNRLKYNSAADIDTKIKYGFLGEVVLFGVLYVIFKSQPLIARGYFYNPLENSETKGYDSYHLVETDGKTEL